MPTNVVMPQMGESIFEGTITKWLKKVGDSVQRDEPLFEISTDKVDAEIPASASGVLREIKVAEGATVEINTVVAVIAEIGEASGGGDAVTVDAAKEAKASAVATAPENAHEPVPPPGGGSQPSAARQTENKKDEPTPPPADGDPLNAPEGFANSTASSSASNGSGAGPGTNVVMPQMGESIFEGTITKWLKKAGDTVQRDEPLFEISTDKVDAEIPAPASGVLREIKVQEGKTVEINTVVAVIGGRGAGAASPQTSPSAPSPDKKQAAPSAPQPQQAAASASAGERIRSSPLVRRIAKDNNLDLGQISGTGSGGRITKEDALGHLSQHGKGSAAPAPQASAPAASVATTSPAAQAQPSAAAASGAQVGAPTPGELVPLSKMRGIIAQRMVESKHTSAHVHTVFKIDMTRIVRLREKEKSKYEQRNGVKLTFMPFIASAAVTCLRKMPIINASMEGNAIRYHQNINLGIAVALDWGLIVPVVKQAEERSFLGIARAIADLAARARAKKLKPEEASGGTFTITNPGIFGEQFGTPVINQPETAILGVGGMFKEPTVLTDADGNDTIAIRSIMRLTLGFDHRIIDGADAGKFMAEMKKTLENWTGEIG
ncbi:MAG TPA: 2-oxoglutarate dehydrogenase, E2 component, dihydrolipoamide succinyltransferase [Acidobacteriaceae bacterium]|nr:2-oxoglutarate dehydrogenase, E2 component, dihydrolipoamide succinyltransferase [Acidobacteriaceae bacterium]